jgi:hypothetical protein
VRINAIEMRRPAPREATVFGRPMRSMSTPPTRKPEMLPRMATLVTHAADVARTRVGNNSARIAPSAGVSMVAPIVATKIDAARNQPELRR